MRTDKLILRSFLYDKLSRCPSEHPSFLFLAVTRPRKFILQQKKFFLLLHRYKPSFKRRDDHAGFFMQKASMYRDMGAFPI